MPWDITQLCRRGKLESVLLHENTMFPEAEVVKLINSIRADPEQFLDRDTSRHHHEPTQEEIADFCRAFRMFDERQPVGVAEICLLEKIVSL